MVGHFETNKAVRYVRGGVDLSLTYTPRVKSRVMLMFFINFQSREKIGATLREVPELPGNSVEKDFLAGYQLLAKLRSLGFRLANGVAGATEVGESHLRILTRQNHSWSASTESGQNCLLHALRCALAVAGISWDINIDAWPDQSVGSSNALQSAFRLARDVVG